MDNVNQLNTKAFYKAVRVAGSQAKLARQLKVSTQCVNNWVLRQMIPPERAVDVERITGVNRRELQLYFPWD